VPVQVMETVRVVPYARISISRRGSLFKALRPSYGSQPCLNHKLSTTLTQPYQTAMASRAQQFGAGPSNSDFPNQ
jgi:hypothetical protein